MPETKTDRLKLSMIEKILENDTYKTNSGLRVQLTDALYGLSMVALDQLTVIVGCKVAEALSSAGEFNAGRLTRCNNQLSSMQVRHQRAHNALLEFYQAVKVAGTGDTSRMQHAYQAVNAYLEWHDKSYPMAEKKCDCEDKGRGNFHVEGCHLYVGPGTHSTV